MKVTPNLEMALRRAAASLSKTPPELRLFKVKPTKKVRPCAYNKDAPDCTESNCRCH